MPGTVNAKCKELFPHEDVLNLNKFYGDPSGRNGVVDSKWFKENIVKWRSEEHTSELQSH